MTKVKSLLDFMSPEQQAKALRRAAKRIENNKNSEISPEMYFIGEFGSYFGWEGVLAIKRGYIEITDSQGELHHAPFTIEEAQVLHEASKKVWYAQEVERARAFLVAINAAGAKFPGVEFEKNIRPFKDRAK